MSSPRSRNHCGLKTLAWETNLAQVRAPAGLTCPVGRATVRPFVQFTKALSRKTKAPTGEETRQLGCLEVAMRGKLALWILLAATIGAGLCTTACGGGSSAPSLPAITVSVSPPSPAVSQGATQTFTASVSGTTNTAVTWSVQEGAAGGSVTSAGVYTAPSTAGTIHVEATSQADSTKSATATVTVPSVSVAISPSAAMVDQGATGSFSATVSGTVINTLVNWSVQEGAAGGIVSSSGLYTAPQASGTFHLVATSQADPTKSAASLITVPMVSVSVSPMSDTLGPNGSRIFVATVNGTVVASNVTWSILEGAAGGSITSGGIYSAPTTTGTFHVIATDVGDPTVSGEAIVTVVSSGFTAVGNMSAPRWGPVALLLPDGRVLVVGGVKSSNGSGQDCVEPLAFNTSIEIFDPATAGFETDGSQSYQFLSGTGTVLADGSALITEGDHGLFVDADGFCEDFVTNSASLFKPSSGAFPVIQVTPGMTQGRAGASATLLQSGKVLVAGGNGGGPTIVPPPLLPSAELYNPATGTFTLTGSMAVPREAHAAALLVDGRVLIAGGSVSPVIEATATAELYGPATGTFTPTGSMTTVRLGFTATLLPNGKVLMAGGNDYSSHILATAELYDPVTGTFTATGSMATPRAYHTATLLPNRKVLVVGGTSGSNTLAATAELYDPDTGTFSLTGGLATARVGHTATLLQNGEVLVIGGSNFSGFLASAEIYK